MNRSQFIKMTSLFVAGNVFKPKEMFSIPRVDIGSYLIPTLLNNEIKNLHNTYKVNVNNMLTSTELVEKSIDLIINNDPGHPVARKYKNHQERVVKRKKNTASLNGEGLDSVNTVLKNRMNDDRVKASTATHIVSDLNTLNISAWENYCDKHEKQPCEEDDKVYVHSLENNPNQDVFYVNRVLDYILYNPIYYCIGLPVEDPQKNFINESMARDIIAKNKTYKTIDKMYYHTQRFRFLGNQCNKDRKPKDTVIYWNYDMAIHEYFALSPVKACGDPSLECQVASGSTRPNVR